MIVRRAEFKRQRKYKARMRKRNPIQRFFRVEMAKLYGEIDAFCFPVATPLLANVRRPVGASTQWGGTTSYDSRNV